MKPHPNHVLAVAVVIAAAAFAEFSDSRVTQAATAGSDPSVPPASTVFKAADSRDGNVQDLTY